MIVLPRALFYACGAVGVTLLALWPTVHRVRGTSMTPTYRPGEVLVAVRRWPTRLLRPGVVVVFSDGRGRLLAKRVAAAAGDTLEAVAGVICLNGWRTRWERADVGVGAWHIRLLARPSDGGYRPYDGNWGPISLPADELFVMGDNPPESSDSRAFGTISTGVVREVVVAIPSVWAPGAKAPCPTRRAAE